MENVTGSEMSFVTNTTDLRFATNSSDYVSSYTLDKTTIYYLRLFSMVSHSVTFLLGVAGNGFVIWIATFKMKKTVNVIWFLNLAIADFIFDVFLPLHIVSTAMKWHWPFGSFMCKTAHTVLHLNMLVSIFFLVLISIDRCFSVQFPVWSRNHRTPSLAYKIAFATWLVAVIISAPYPAFYDITPPLWNNTTFCWETYAVPWEDFSDEAFYTIEMREKITVITRFITMFLIPFAVIITCYGIIILKIKNRQLSPSSRPFKLIIVILILFFVCWFPYHTIPVLDSYGTDSFWRYMSGTVGTNLATCLAYFNSCLNPILYVFIGKDFKETFRKSIVSVFERAFNEHPTVAALDSQDCYSDEDMKLNNFGYVQTTKTDSAVRDV